MQRRLFGKVGSVLDDPGARARAVALGHVERYVPGPAGRGKRLRCDGARCRFDTRQRQGR